MLVKLRIRAEKWVLHSAYDPRLLWCLWLCNDEEWIYFKEAFTRRAGVLYGVRRLGKEKHTKMWNEEKYHRGRKNGFLYRKVKGYEGRMVKTIMLRNGHQRGGRVD